MRKISTVFYAFALLFFAQSFAHAQGIIIPFPCEMRPCRPVPRPQPVPNYLPIKSIKLDTKIVGQVATTAVEQIFRNDSNMTLEGTYFFPIPENASIEEFAIWENGKKLVGEVRSREEARRIYDEIVRKQRDPGLLEYAGKDLFQASIFPIPPHSDKKLELKYTQVLKADSGTVAYKYPLGTGRQLWTPPPLMPQTREDRTGVRQTVQTISGRIEISASEAVRNIYSPTHKIDVQNKGEKSAVISFETSASNADLELFYGLSNKDFGMSLVTYREAGKDGYFLINLSPRDEVADRVIVKKDVVFVLDTSGSMADVGKMDKAKSALAFGIRTLRAGDKFNVINFAGEEHLMTANLIDADEAGKRRGLDFVEKLEPNGGTNINDALIAALNQLKGGERPKMLVFMTDGLPTAGETDAKKILLHTAKARTTDVRIFPFGFGYDVNTNLLDALGSENSGVSDYVQPKEDLEIKVSNFFSRVSSPVLSDVKLDFGGVETDLMYPRKLTDLFKGMQLSIIGRYKNDSDLKNITLRLTGKTGSEAKSFDYNNLSFPKDSRENQFLPRLWASRRVGWLIEQLRNNGETKEVRDEIIQLGTRYGIVTPYTSYLAIDGTETRFQTDGTGTGRGSGRPTARVAPSAVVDISGESAVKQSVQQNTMQANVTVTADDKDEETRVIERDSANNQFVGNKNFFNTNGVWTDAEFDANQKQREVNIKYGSDEFFTLLAKEKQLAQYLKLGENVVVVWKNVVYRITK